MSGPPSPRRIVVVGGGISGLAAAHRLCELAREQRAPCRVTLLEEREVLGGPIATVRDGDLLLEAGPDQFVTHKPAAIALCERLGLAAELLELGGARFAPAVVHRDRPRPLPAGFALIAPTRLVPLLGSTLFSWRGKARIALERWVPPRGGRGDESVADFVTRRFGRELLDRVAEPILGAIFTADADRMSTELALPRYVALERRHGSVTRGLLQARAGTAGKRDADGEARGARLEREAGALGAGLVSLKGGLGRLVDRVAAGLDGAEIRLRARAVRLERDAPRGCWRLGVQGQAPIEADAVILACPAGAAARLLAGDGPLAAELQRLEYAGCATVYLLYPRRARRGELRGSGFFVPRTLGHPLLACSYVSRKFPERAPRDTLLLRAFLGGVRHPEVVDLEDDRLVALTRAFVERVLGLDGEPLHHRCFRHPRSMPQFDVGHAERLAAIGRRLAAHPGLGLCGASVGATGLPDCIGSGGRAAEAVLADLPVDSPLAVTSGGHD